MTGVVHVVTALERGGAQRVVLGIAAGLHDPGRPQLVITGPRVEAGIDDEAEERLGARLLRVRDLGNAVSPLRDAACLVELTRVIDGLVDKLRSPVVVHTHSSKAGVLGRLAARAVRGVACVHTVHGFGFEALGGRHRWMFESAERVSDVCDVVVFVSEADRARAEALGLYRRAQARVIRAGIDPAPFAALVDEKRSGHTAVTVANLKPQKDPLFHVEVLAAWRARDPLARLVLLGDGPLRGEVERRARALGVADALTLPGFVDDTRGHLAAADVFLLASAWEGLPCAVLEATAAGLPCVVRDTGYAGELAWAKRLRALPVDAPAAAFADALVDAVGSVASARPVKIPRAFTRKGMLAELSELYDELVGPPRPTGEMLRRRPLRRPSRGPSRSGR